VTVVTNGKLSRTKVTSEELMGHLRLKKHAYSCAHVKSKSRKKRGVEICGSRLHR